MKKLIIGLMLCFSFSAFAKKPLITDNFVVTKIILNEEKKYYETSLELMAGIYKADESFVKCLQKSLEKKKAAKITYEAMGLKITSCDI